MDMADLEVVVPPLIAEDGAAFAIFSEAMDEAAKKYRSLRALGARKEDARFVLPNAAATRIVVTMNFRELRHFFALRCDKAAQWEIRALAKEMLCQSYEIAPPVFEDLYKRFIENRR